ncbi:cation transporter, partial [Campylobacter coli]|nr:cation transporter [Campylobacter coli]MDC7792217.1 cation transporter [Campylobacter coli]
NIDDLKEFEQLSYDLSHDLLHRFEIGHITIQPLRSKNEI